MFSIANENYQEISLSLQELFKFIKDLNVLEIKNQTFNLEYFLSSDYKMLLNLYGHKGSNSKESCFYCRKNLKDIPDINEDLFITRKLSDSFEADGHREPIIKFIDYKNCVIDLLHLLLRVSDHLFEILIAKLIKIDNNSGSDIERRPYFKIFMDFLKDKCKISNPWYVSSKSEDKIKLRSLNGNERIKIFERIFQEYETMDIKTGQNIKKRKNFTDIFPGSNETNKKFIDESNVWYVFYENLNSIKRYDIIDLDKLDSSFKKWLRVYLKILWENLSKKTIPPYIHIMCFHLCEILQNYGNINKFTTQSLEKLNDFTTQYYHISSNKKNYQKGFLLQILKKRNRIEFYQHEGNSSDFIHLKRDPRKRNFYNESSSESSYNDDDASDESSYNADGTSDEEDAIAISSDES
jgi:hypothetical protein